MLRRITITFGYAIWVVISFILAQLLVYVLLMAYQAIAGSLDLTLAFSEATLGAVTAALTYLLTIAIAVGFPRIKNHITTITELGLDRLPEWRDIILAPLAAIVYIVTTALLAYFAVNIEGFDPNQSQDIAFSSFSNDIEYVLAFLTLVVMAPIAEEVLFRGYLFSKIRRHASVIATILVTSVVFALLHLPGLDESGNIQWQWNAAVDVFALALVLAGLREYTGGIWASILLHMMKNGLAFYVLFINNDILRTIGG